MAASAHGMSAMGSEMPVFHPIQPLLYQLGMGALTASLRAAASVADGERAGDLAPAAAAGMAAHEDAPAVAAADTAGEPAPDAAPAPALNWQNQK